MSNKKVSEDLARCQIKERRVNLKSKRKRNLMKKAIELCKMLDMKILIVFRDGDTNKLSIYNSGDQKNGHFNLKTVHEELRQSQLRGIPVRFFDDDDYKSLKLGYKSGQPEYKELLDEFISEERDQTQTIRSNDYSVQPNFESLENKISSSIQEAYDLCDQLIDGPPSKRLKNNEFDISEKNLNSLFSFENPQKTSSIVSPRQGPVLIDSQAQETPQNADKLEMTHNADFDNESLYIKFEMKQSPRKIGQNDLFDHSSVSFADLS